MDGTSTAGPGRIEARPANSENKNVASRSRGNAQRSVDPAAIQPRGTAGRVFCMRNSRCVQPVLLLLVVPLAACTVGPDFVKPEVSFNSSWREHEDGVRAENGAADRVWWQALDSPTLTTLVESAYNGNPNLQAAAAQSALIGVAESALYPSFSVSGFFGTGSTELGTASLSDLFTWNGRALQVGGSFVFPIFNYGRLTNQVRVQDAAFQEAVLNYQNTVLAAQEDVENALAAFVYGKRTAAALEQAAASARRTTALALTQYKEGETSFTTLLNAYESQLQVENRLAQSRGQVLLGLISVYRSLGGGWQIREGRSVISESVANDMRQRTDWGEMLNTGGATMPPAGTQVPAPEEAQHR